MHFEKVLLRSILASLFILLILTQIVGCHSNKSKLKRSNYRSIELEIDSISYFNPFEQGLPPEAFTLEDSLYGYGSLMIKIRIANNSNFDAAICCYKSEYGFLSIVHADFLQLWGKPARLNSTAYIFDTCQDKCSLKPDEYQWFSTGMTWNHDKYCIDSFLLNIWIHEEDNKKSEKAIYFRGHACKI